MNNFSIIFRDSLLRSDEAKERIVADLAKNEVIDLLLKPFVVEID